MLMQYRIYNLNLPEQEEYFNLKYQYNIDKARYFLKTKVNLHRMFIRLTPLFYSLAITNEAIKIASKSLRRLK